MAAACLLLAGNHVASGDVAPATVSLTVSNASDVVDGDTSSPGALLADPGSDGISLREAVLAADNAPSGMHVYIDFVDGLSGQTIQLAPGRPAPAHP